MSLTQYYTATTLDGFIADPNHSLDWLFTRKQEKDGPLNYGDFIANVGALAMGSTTYEWILDHEFADKDPADWKWPYDIPAGCSRTGSCASCPAHPSNSRAVTWHACTRSSSPPPAAGTSGSSAAATSPASSRTPGSSTRSSCTSRPLRSAAAHRCCPRRLELRLEELGRNGDFACARYSVVRPPT